MSYFHFYQRNALRRKNKSSIFRYIQLMVSTLFFLDTFRLTVETLEMTKSKLQQHDIELSLRFQRQRVHLKTKLHRIVTSSELRYEACIEKTIRTT